MMNIIDNRTSLGISFEDLKFLYHELELTWNNYNIPGYHREIFFRYIEMLNQNSIPVFIAKEIDKIEKGISPIIFTMENIKAREFFIGKMKNIDEKIKNSNNKLLDVYEMECASIIIRLRESTVNVIENILS